MSTESLSLATPQPTNLNQQQRNERNTVKNLTEKQAARLSKVEAKYPHFTFTVFDTNDKHETVTAWGVGVTDTDADLSKAYAAKPETKNGFKRQTAHTERGNAELTKAIKAASAALWHCQPVFS